MRIYAVAIALVLMALASCTTITNVAPIECHVTIHLDTLTLATDSVTFEPVEHADACRAKWERGY